ncbi:hypothetical protein PI125_g25695 [Phytophthora idaei]|nr:hypothetical protein PI125_g25695 [Phytophthora idaei]
MGATESPEVTTPAGPNSVWNVVLQVLNSTIGGNTRVQRTRAMTPTDATVTISAMSAPVSAPGVAAAGMPTAKNVVVAVGPPVAPSTTVAGVSVVQSVAAAGVRTASTSLNVEPVSGSCSGGQRAPSTVQKLQGGSVYGVGVV